jgi:glutathione S-transferase
VIDQWMDFCSLHVGQAMDRIVYNRIFAPVTGRPVDEKAVREGEALLQRFLPVVDAVLERQQYLAGEDLTLADTVLLSVLDPAEAASVDLGAYSRLGRWRTELSRQSFYQRCHHSYQEQLEKFRAG